MGPMLDSCEVWGTSADTAVSRPVGLEGGSEEVWAGEGAEGTTCGACEGAHLNIAVCGAICCAGCVQAGMV